MVWAAFLLIAGGAACIAYVAYALFHTGRPALQRPAAASEGLRQTAEGPASPLVPPPYSVESGASVPASPSAFRRVELEGLAETLRVLSAARPHRQNPDSGITVQGTLYLDYGRRIFRLQSGDGDQMLKLFPELKRIGAGTMSIDAAAFRILCGPAIYSYTASELEQILFQSGGLALLPSSPAAPAPLFLTDQFEQVRQYLKRRAQVGAA